ncbi:MAG: transposase [Acetobacteraceae bacterium]|nr:transposase [Acetobacteraceae bacterium]
MTATIAQTLGVDIAKATLDVYLHPEAAAQQFANTQAGIAALLAWLQPYAISRVVFEPTGAYHRLFERQVGSTGLPMVKVNPLQARRFAEAIGRRAKTDAVDAAMLARFGALDELQPRPMVSQTLSDMKELLVARRGLIKDRVAAGKPPKVAITAVMRKLVILANALLHQGRAWTPIAA